MGSSAPHGRTMSSAFNADSPGYRDWALSFRLSLSILRIIDQSCRKSCRASQIRWRQNVKPTLTLSSGCSSTIWSFRFIPERGYLPDQRSSGRRGSSYGIADAPGGSRLGNDDLHTRHLRHQVVARIRSNLRVRLTEPVRRRLGVPDHLYLTRPCQSKLHQKRPRL